MPDVVGIRFKNCGKIYDFQVNGFAVQQGNAVIVESEFGLNIGTVVIGPRTIEDTDRNFKKILRIATEKDLKQKESNELFAKEANSYCLERIMARGIPMKLVCTEVTLDRKRIVFYFTADGRIDFRELVKDLAAKFKTRIEMRQIGVRDKAKMIGGLGLCGKHLCCRVFLTAFEPISIKMAKQQELVLNTGKLSGVCGRLMCCLGFEYDEPASLGSSVSGEETISLSEEVEELAVVTEEPEGKSPEPLPNTSVESPVISEDTKQAGAEIKSKEGLSKRKKKRRRRRRRGRFHKKNE